jgi:hypothetical protein
VRVRACTHALAAAALQLHKHSTSIMKADSKQAAEVQLTREGLLLGGSVALRLMFQYLGPGCYLPVSLVCKDWKNEYLRNVKHGSSGPETVYKSYLQNPALWLQLKEHNMHERILPDSVGRHACQAVTESFGVPYKAHRANLQCVRGKTLKALHDANIAFDVET